MEADLDLSAFSTVADVRQDLKVWQQIARMLSSRQMPPPESAQPTDQQWSQMHAWVKGLLTEEAKARAGDPGPVLLRRLSNAEYTYTLRDVTGINSLDPAREFPVDGAAGEGFTNVGSGQGMSPAVIQKYLDAAKHVADHLVLHDRGIRFSPVTTRRDQTDELLGMIQAFYRQFTDDGGGSSVDLQGIRFDTNQGGRMPLERYLRVTFAHRAELSDGRMSLEKLASDSGLSAKYLTKLWTVLSASSHPDSPLLDRVRLRWQSASEMADQSGVIAEIETLQKSLWKYNSVGHIGRLGGPESWMEATTPEAESLGLAELAAASPDDFAKALRDFRELFPPALCYARIVPVDEVVTWRLFYREDHELQRLMLNDQQAAELNRLWDELLFVSQEPLKLQVALEQLSEFATQDAPELVKAFAPLHEPVRQRAEAFKQQMVASEPSHVAGVLRFADRAWRRPLVPAEHQALHSLYDHLRGDGIAHEEAMRLLLARVLTSPEFLYKLEQAHAGTQAAPVSPLELATRLSYFLWSSLPDDTLRTEAESGELMGDESLIRHTHRMLDDSRTRRLAIHFACQWMHIRDFDQNNDKNESLYPEFAALRGPMYEEAVRFFEDLFRRDGSVMEILNASHTFVNAPLANHYGLERTMADTPDEAWHRVEHVNEQGRGGVLGMAAVLASQSGASRTSPILRGNWVYETLLGQRLPRPPANVPQLPAELPSGLSERAMIEQHSRDAACAKCHVQIDPFGFALEQYDAIGRKRPVAMDTMTELPDGKKVAGIEGLKDYLVHDRREDFVRQFCRKLLGYALGRELMLSDEPLLDEMQQRLAAENYRVRVAVEAIVASPQFRSVRGADAPHDR
jgi:hypothetical protein